MGLTGKTYIVVILLHSDDHRHIIECDSAQTKIGVIRDFSDLLYEGVKVKRFHFIDGSDEITEPKIVLLSR